MVMSYLKGKDIKTKGDCLVYCFSRKIEKILDGHIANLIITNEGSPLQKPVGFEKW